MARRLGFPKHSGKSEMLQDARTASDTDRRRFSREEHQLLKSEGGEFVTGNEDAKMRDSVC